MLAEHTRADDAAHWAKRLLVPHGAAGTTFAHVSKTFPPPALSPESGARYEPDRC